MTVYNAPLLLFLVLCTSLMTHGGANGGRFLRATEIEAASPPIAATPFRALQDTVEDDHNHEENGNEVHNGVETEGDGIHLDEHEDEDHHDETVATSSPLEEEDDHLHEGEDEDHMHEGEDEDHMHEGDDEDHLHEGEDEDHDHDEDEDHHEEDEDHHEGDGHDHGDHDHDEDLTTTTSAADSESKPWGQAIGFALLVNLATLIGLLVLIPTIMAGAFCSKWKQPSQARSERLHYVLSNVIPSFACGALLATTVFLILPEAILLIASATGLMEHDHRRQLQDEAHDSAETQLAWKFGASLLGGYLIPVILGSVFPHAHEADVVPECPVCKDNNAGEDPVAAHVPVVVDKGEMSTTAGTTQFCDKEGCSSLHSEHPIEEGGEDDDEEEVDVWDAETDDEETLDRKSGEDSGPVKPEAALAPVNAPKKIDVIPPRKRIDYRLAASILLGDSFHNFADGIFLGTAFTVCSNAVAYAIVAATIYHELAQELADFFLLTTHVGLSPWIALGLNFLSGLSVMLGVVVILALNVTQMATGCILAISAGVYVYIAASEIAPRLEKAIKHLKDRAVSILCFALGAVPIGLVLLTHGHCDAHV